jgi:regulator of RNase E activity RraA
LVYIYFVSSKPIKEKSIPTGDIIMADRKLSYGDLLELKRWNTPTIYNGWEQITAHDTAAECFNIEEIHDFMPQMGPMVGYAVTVVCEPSNPKHKQKNSRAFLEYLNYVDSVQGPKIIFMQDLDKPRVVGSFWGEVTSNCHRALGCVGTITDGAIRDVDEITNAGFKAIARRLCVGHAHVTPIRWGCEVEVFGRKVLPGQLCHADKHGFLLIPEEDQSKLLEATRFMDSNECKTAIAATRSGSGKSGKQILRNMENAIKQFRENAREKFKKKGEW